VWSSEVIEHVADTARWLSEVRRVLVPRGRLLLTTPSHGRLRLLVGGIERFSEPLGDHLHLYTARSLRELLQAFGFGEISVQTAAGLPLARRLLLARAVR
jgi:2-polyprenyl-3-methyl-5-hydroxy-6-metoxy-1,4-benzoquinol methylase